LTLLNSVIPEIEADILCHQQVKESQNLSHWWDEAKSRFRETSIQICKRRNRIATVRRDEILTALSQPNIPRDCEEELNQELQDLNENLNKGAQIRSRTKLAEDFETPSVFLRNRKTKRREKDHLLPKSGEQNA